MKKLLVLLMAFCFILTACNNNKSSKKQNIFNRDKDDYGRNDNRNNDNDDDKNYENTGNTGWSQRDKNTFLKECAASFDENQGDLANRICPCVLEKMEKEFASYNEAETKGGEAAGEKLALQCKEEIIGNSDNDNTGSNWSRSDENNFMEGCEGTAAQNVGAARANQYCDCMLQKMKKMYSNYAEAERKLANKSQEEINEMAADCNK